MSNATKIIKESSPLRQYVIAGHYREYLSWLKDNNLSQQDAVYVSDPLMGLCGLRFGVDSELITTGTWYADPEKVEAVKRCRILSECLYP